MTDSLYSLAEVQNLLGVSRTTVFNLVRSGKLRCVKIGRRSLVTASELDRYIASLEGGGTPPRV